MEAPVVSVVVPTRNRCHLLARMVSAIEAQDGPDLVELVIVDDSSSDATASVLAELVASSTVELRVGSTDRPSGAAAARNVGWRMARGGVVAFTDDDCRPDAGWLLHLLAGLGDADVVQGVTTYDPAEAEGRGPFSQVIDVGGWTGQFETSNVAYRRELLERVGGFDEHFGGDSFGEDVDLGWRAVEHGARTAFAAGAVVVHDVKRGPALVEVRSCLRGARRWRHLGKLVRDHPGYRDVRLLRDPFLNAAHPPTWLALIGSLVLLVGRGRAARALGLVAWLPWLRHRSIDAPRPGCRRRDLPYVLPVAFLVDASRAITVARSGLRYRRLLL